MWLNFAAGLIAGTTPTIGNLMLSRSSGRATVLAVLQATTIALKSNCLVALSIKVSTLSIKNWSSLSP